MRTVGIGNRWVAAGADGRKWDHADYTKDAQEHCALLCGNSEAHLQAERYDKTSIIPGTLNSLAQTCTPRNSALPAGLHAVLRACGSS